MAQVHRFCDSVAVHLGPGSPVFYFDAATARRLANAIATAAADIKARPVTESTFESTQLPDGTDSSGACAQPFPRGGDLPVIFRKHWSREDRRWIVTAGFPTLWANSSDWWDIVCYDADEEHGAASPEWFKKGRPATESEYIPLLLELLMVYGKEDKNSPAFNLVVYEKFHSFFNDRRKDGWKKARAK